MLHLHGYKDEPRSCIWMGQKLLPGAALLSAYGEILDDKLPCFSRRLSEGVFTMVDLDYYTRELTNSVSDITAQHGLDERKVILVGYGSSIIFLVVTLLLQTGKLAGAVLLRPRGKLELQIDPLPQLKGIPVFISVGRHDEMMEPEDVEAVITLLDKADANVHVNYHHGGHYPTTEEFDVGKAWILENLPNFTRTT